MRRRIRLWHVAVAIPLVCGLSGWITAASIAGRAERQIEAEKRALRGMGMPASFGAASPPLTKENDAAPLYSKADLSRRGLGSYQGSPYLDREWLNRQRPTLLLLEEASQGLGRTFPSEDQERNTELSKMKELVKLASAASRAAIDAGSFEAALRWARVGYKIVGHCQYAGFLGPHLAVALEAIVMADLERIIAKFGSLASARVHIKGLLARLPDLPDTRQFLGHDALAQVEFWQDIESGVIKPREVLDDRFLEILLSQDWMRKSVHAASLRAYRVVFEEAGGSSDPVAWRSAIAKQESLLAKDSSVKGRLVHRLTSLFPGMCDRLITAQTKRQLASIALDLYAENAKTGGFPKTLPASAPVDIYSKHPFVYRPSMAGFELYSIGSNGKDDGGVRTPSSGFDDIAFGRP